MNLSKRHMILILSFGALGAYADGMPMSGMGDGQGMQGMKNMGSMQGKSDDKRRYHAKGIIRKIDLRMSRMTLAHGPIPDLSWPAMTMTFEVRDKQLFDHLREGEQVDFELMSTGKEGKYAIVRIETMD